MFVRSLVQSTVLFFLLACWLPGYAHAESSRINKRIIGQECWVHIEEIDLDFLARVDTGATSTSLHGTDFMIIDGTDDYRENVGKIINFLTVSTDGKYKRMEAEIAKVQTVVSAGGREKRYMVWLTFTTRGISKRVLANLRDRSRMKYKLLMGRDWLSKDFLVDVDLQEESLALEGEEE